MIFQCDRDMHFLPTSGLEYLFWLFESVPLWICFLCFFSIFLLGFLSLPDHFLRLYDILNSRDVKTLSVFFIANNFPRVVAYNIFLWHLMLHTSLKFWYCHVVTIFSVKDSVSRVKKEVKTLFAHKHNCLHFYTWTLLFHFFYVYILKHLEIIFLNVRYRRKFYFLINWVVSCVIRIY